MFLEVFPWSQPSGMCPWWDIEQLKGQRPKTRWSTTFFHKSPHRCNKKKWPMTSLICIFYLFSSSLTQKINCSVKLGDKMEKGKHLTWIFLCQTSSLKNFYNFLVTLKNSNGMEATDRTVPVKNALPGSKIRLIVRVSLTHRSLPLSLSLQQHLFHISNRLMFLPITQSCPFNRQNWDTF